MSELPEVLYGPVRCGSLEYREIKGRKGPFDRRCEIRTPKGEWVAYSKYEQGYLFWRVVENEDLLYPPRLGYRGGQMLLDFIHDVFTTRDPNKSWGRFRGPRKVVSHD